MTTLALKNVADRIQGSHLIGDCQFQRVSTDTRSIQAGDLFVALKGDRFDAHDFLEQAVQKHAAGVLVEQTRKDFALPQLVVNDSTRALGTIANINRKLFHGPVVAITGSGGKTTVKNLVKNILQHCGEVYATQGNLNNHIGVPLTLFELNPSHDFAVVEMGASGPGEIDYLCRIAEPTVALVNNALRAHVAGFGSVEGVAKAKGEIFAGLGDDGVAIVNVDDPHHAIWLQQIGSRKKFTFSAQGDGADFIAKDVEDLPSGGTRFQLVTPAQEIVIHLSLLGRQNVANALAAAACTYAVGADSSAIKNGLEETAAYKGRMQHRHGKKGSRLIDDSYNANPDAVKAAIDYLAKQTGDTVLVLGDLGELGQNEIQYHQELGQYAKAAGIKRLVTKGVLSKHSSVEFGENAQHFESFDALNNYLLTTISADSVVLVKGSRMSQMEHVVSALAIDGES